MENKIKVIVAPDSFKGSLTNREAGIAIADGVSDACPDSEIVVIPIADGGEGILHTFVSGNVGKIIKHRVHGPLITPVDAELGVYEDIAIIESASACGLTLIPPEKRNPCLTDSGGVGELVLEALKRGFRKILIGLGGSAVNDGGAGMLRALGFRFFDAEGNPVGYGGENLGKIRAIDCSGVVKELKETEFLIACDVTNPLIGPEGASKVFGPQKGATAEEADMLDRNLDHFAQLTSNLLGKEFAHIPGAGAAGGLGFACMAFLNARLLSGIDVVLDHVHFDDVLADADLVITGEGRIDRQTSMGKALHGILRRAKRRKVPVIALGGSVDKNDMDSLLRSGFTAVFPIVSGPIDLEQAMQKDVAIENLRRTACQVTRVFCH